MFAQHIGAAGQVDITDGDESYISCVEFTVYGFTGSMIPQTKQQTDGTLLPAPPNYFNAGYVNANTGVAYAAGSAITADGRYIIDTTGAKFSLNVTDPGDGDFYVYGKPLAGPAPTFSSGGGGAVTIADGADVTLGAKADTAVTNPASSASVVALLKGILTDLNAPLPGISIVGGTTRTSQPTVTVTASAYAAGNCWGGKLTLTNALGTASPSTGAWSSLDLTMHTSTPPALDLVVFGANPAATFTDKSAFPTLSAADNLLVVKRISVVAADWVTVGGSSFATIKIGGLAIKATTAGTLYAAYNVTSGTPTPAATTDFTNLFGFYTDQ